MTSSQIQKIYDLSVALAYGLGAQSGVIPLIKEQVEPGHGIIGCEMHDLNGRGLSHARLSEKNLFEEGSSHIYSRIRI